jgi:hypothetical protein
MADQIYRLRIDLRGAKPPIWRRIAVEPDTTLGQLHQIIQIVMDWDEDHLHQFTLKEQTKKPSAAELERLIGEGRYYDAFAAQRGVRLFSSSTDPMGGPIHMDGEDEDEVTLAEVCPQGKRKLIYEYDFGDSWEHAITLQKIEPADPDVAYPVCLDGRRAAPPDDCGGIYGYYRLLKSLQNPDDEFREEALDWLGEDFDPDTVDLDRINRELAQWREYQRRNR